MGALLLQIVYLLFLDFISYKNLKSKEILHFCNYPVTSRLNFTKAIINNYDKRNNIKYNKKIELVRNFDSVERPYKSILSCNSTLNKYKYTKKYWINDLKKFFNEKKLISYRWIRFYWTQFYKNKQFIKKI